MVNKDSSVEVMTSSEAKAGSRSYFPASMTVVLAAGIAVSSTHTFMLSGSSGSTISAASTISGRISSRYRLNSRTWR